MKINMDGVNVMLCMPIYKDIHGSVASALLETQASLSGAGVKGNVTLEIGCSMVHAARSKLAAEFLKSDATHLFWVDSDIVWKGQDFLKMLALGTKMECVAAAYRLKRDNALYQVNGLREGLMVNEYGCIPIESTGLGFCVVQRKIMEQIASTAPKFQYPDSKEMIPRTFRFDERDGVPRGEDIAFFDDVRELGYGVWCDPNIQLGHLGFKQFTGALSEQMEMSDEGMAA